MVYAFDEAILTDLPKAEQAAFEGGFRILHEKATTSLDEQKEHFGWRDGLSMPVIEGVPAERPKKKTQESWTGPLRPGEFVLGYHNDYDAFTENPTADPADDPANHLPIVHDGTRKSLGRNGTYLVYREMTQDVLKFWDYLATHSREPGDDPAARAIALGTKMVGRWPGGAPLITSPTGDNPEHATDNTFTYAEDALGVRCPLGAHIRRANPRDAVAPDRGHDVSLQMVRKHQMIRRGRAFGRPVSEKLDPRDPGGARQAGPRAAWPPLHLPRRQHQPTVRVRAAGLDPLGQLRGAVQGRRPDLRRATAARSRESQRRVHVPGRPGATEVQADAAVHAARRRRVFLPAGHRRPALHLPPPVRIMRSFFLALLFGVGVLIALVFLSIPIFLRSLFRGARAFHPRGTGCRAEVTALDDVVGSPLAGPARVRLSSATADENSPSPSILGMAIKVGSDQDLRRRHVRILHEGRRGDQAH